MKVLEKLNNILRPVRVFGLALFFGVLVSIGLSVASYANDDPFTEIKDLQNKKSIVSDKQIQANAKEFSYMKDKYDFTKQSFGIDVSEWQGKIDFEKLKLAGVDFVMIRVGVRNEGIQEDSRFEYNIQEALKYNINVGIYFYSTARTEFEALEEAKWVVDKLSNYKITYPVAYDMENIGSYSTQGLSNTQVNKNAKVFLDYVSNNGYVGCLYSNANDLIYHWDEDFLGNYMIWYAYWETDAEYDGNLVMWQYTDSGKINGINEKVDLNIAYFRYVGN